VDGGQIPGRKRHERQSEWRRLVRCDARGSKRLRDRAFALPPGWEDEPVRCVAGVAEGRVVNPVTIRWIDPASAGGALALGPKAHQGAVKNVREGAAQGEQGRNAGAGAA
jgi:hypothetical protein